MMLGELLRIIRQERGLTIGELSRRSGLSYEQIRQIERDEVRVPVHRLLALADVYDAPASAILARLEHLNGTDKPNVFDVGLRLLGARKAACQARHDQMAVLRPAVVMLERRLVDVAMQWVTRASAPEHELVGD